MKKELTSREAGSFCFGVGALFYVSFQKGIASFAAVKGQACPFLGAAFPLLYSQKGGGFAPPFVSPHGGEHSPEPPPTRRGFGLGCRLGRSWTVPTGHQDPPRTPRKARSAQAYRKRGSKGDEVSPAGSVGDGRSPLATIAPL